MLKRQITKEEMISLAKDFDLTSYIDVNNLIDSLHIEQKKETHICLTTTDKSVVETILTEEFDVPTILNVNGTARITIQYGDENYSILTDYGEMFVDKDGFIKFLKAGQNNVSGSLSIRNDLLKNIKFNIVYSPEYTDIDTDSWRYMLLASDKLIMALNANHILYTGEKNFINSLVIPYFSEKRLLFAIGNAQYIKSSEWQDAVKRVQILLGDKFETFPIFTESITDERKQRYAGHAQTLSSIFHEVQKNSLELRIQHCKEIENYKTTLFEHLLLQLKEKMEKSLTTGESGLQTAYLNKEVVTESKKHIEDNIDLFLQIPLTAKMRNATDDFAKLFKKSIEEDIDFSQDIKQDARFLTRYLSMIWTEFSENQNITLYKEFEREAKMLLEMMKLDLSHITRNIRNLDIQENIKKVIESSFSVNTFFSRKTTSGSSTTDALTIGGVIAGIFVTPLGWMAVLASEIIKIVGKDSMDQEYKATLKIKIAEMIDKNKADIQRQAEKRFKQASTNFHNEILKSYDELLASINQIVRKEEEKASKSSEILKTINSII